MNHPHGKTDATLDTSHLARNRRCGRSRVAGGELLGATKQHTQPGDRVLRDVQGALPIERRRVSRRLLAVPVVQDCLFGTAPAAHLLQHPSRRPALPEDLPAARPARAQEPARAGSVIGRRLHCPTVGRQPRTSLAGASDRPWGRGWRRGARHRKDGQDHQPRGYGGWAEIRPASGASTGKHPPGRSSA